mmetsp:Transcript_10585/g.15495  ORF Transcript_10585/g.15495 Transcript_10585/m.15495 type:complete len:341 (-) Transcript_10585:1879-2901(-)
MNDEPVKETSSESKPIKLTPKSAFKLKKPLIKDKRSKAIHEESTSTFKTAETNHSDINASTTQEPSNVNSQTSSQKNENNKRHLNLTHDGQPTNLKKEEHQAKHNKRRKQNRRKQRKSSKKKGKKNTPNSILTSMARPRKSHKNQQEPKRRKIPKRKIVIRNIHRSLSLDQFIAQFIQPFEDKIVYFDYVCQENRPSNYAFVTFTNKPHLLDFYKQFHKSFVDSESQQVMPPLSPKQKSYFRIYIEYAPFQQTPISNIVNLAQEDQDDESSESFLIAPNKISRYQEIKFQKSAKLIGTIEEDDHYKGFFKSIGTNSRRNGQYSCSASSHGYLRNGETNEK